MNARVFSPFLRHHEVVPDHEHLLDYSSFDLALGVNFNGLK